MPSNIKGKKIGVFHTLESAFRQLFRKPALQELEAEKLSVETARSLSDLPVP